MSGTIRTELKPAVCRTLASRKSAAASAVSGTMIGSRDPNDVAEERAVGLEDDLRAWTRSTLLFVHPCGVGLELLAGLVEQRQTDAVAGHQRARFVTPAPERRV